MNQANPVPEHRDDALSQRAEDELAALVGPPRAPRRRRALLVSAVAIASVVLVAVVGAIALNNVEPDPPAADEPFYATTAQLEGRADLVVRATVTSTREQRSGGFPETVATATVNQVGKGDIATGASVEVAYATPGSGPETPSGLRAGGEYVLLLVTDGGGPAHLVNTTQGYYTVSADRVTPTPDNPVELSADVKQKLAVQ